ncbi:MAG: hypothetical protein HYU77_10235 [Betaproteobacteria bacterium]|nr:hypothetical protein [Betaproteobacteria bacterium]
MNVVKIRLGVLVLGLAAPAAGLAAEGITGITTDPVSAKAGQPVKIVVAGDPEQNNCGMRVEYGDGDGQDVKIKFDEGVFPRTLTRTYGKPGTYNITAKGKRVTTHFPCPGQAKISLVVEGAAGGAMMKSPMAGGAMTKSPMAGGAGGMAACPAGWMMKGKMGKDGSFSCMPQMPAAKIDCGPGLGYFESAGTIGCRKGKK